MAYRLVAVKGPLRGRTFVVVKTETKIGRDPQSDLVLPDEYVSRLHATIVERGDKHLMVNASPNGTLVNGKRVERATLEPGDEIALGASTVLRYEGRITAAGPGGPPAVKPEEEKKPPAPPLAPPTQPLWSRRPKLLIGGAIYAAALIALGVFLYTQRRTKQAERPPILTRAEIENDLTRPLQRDRDPAEGDRALRRAEELYQQRYVDPANLHRAIVAFKEAEAYLGTSLTQPRHLRMFDEVLEELAGKVERLYFEAFALQNSGRYDDARQRYAEILRYVTRPESAIHKNAIKHIDALQPFLEEKGRRQP